MTNKQGTEWESEIVQKVQEQDTLYHSADRYPKRGQKGEPDLYIGVPNGKHSYPALIWKRLVKGDGQRRKPDGVRAVVVLDWEDFQEMLHYMPVTFDVQAKWTERLNVTRVLGELRSWMREHA